MFISGVEIMSLAGARGARHVFTGDMLFPGGPGNTCGCAITLWNYPASLSSVRRAR